MFLSIGGNLLVGPACNAEPARQPDDSYGGGRSTAGRNAEGFGNIFSLDGNVLH